MFGEDVSLVSESLLAGRWRVSMRLGRGGMGSVYRATDVELRREVAIKVLRADAAVVPHVRQRFLREAQFLARLDSPAVVRVFDVVADHEPPFFVQEFILGEDLDALVRRDGPLEPRRVRRLARDLASALATIHAAGLVHRDVKAANLLVDAQGRGRLVDLGLAQDDELTRLTGVNQILGTVLYMAPETVRSADATAATDVFQAGLVICFALTGRFPDRRAEDVLDDLAIVADLRVPTPPPPEGLPGDLRDLIVACTTKDPAGRPADGGELLRLLEQGGARGRTTGASVPRAVPPPSALPGSVSPGKRSALPLFFCILALLVSAVFVVRSGVRMDPVLTAAVARGTVLLPDGIILRLDREVAAEPRWMVTRSGAAIEQGSFESEGALWSVALGGGRPGQVWTVAVVDDYRRSETREVELPSAVFRQEPEVSRAAGELHVRWSLNAEVEPIAIVSWTSLPPEENGRMTPSGRTPGAGRALGQGLRRDLVVRWRLELGRRVLAEGDLPPSAGAGRVDGGGVGW